ncbi:hypothetical protein VQL36_20490 [Chengkuizengella sp. SCS-71B]|uniref:hypothetical protein n=1 Tax=Chengkuizengella sp. SCS-71B TaxID=3115290 RepID=UPI0032C245CB
MRDDLRSIFSELSSEKHITTELINTDVVKWIPILPIGKSSRKMGISEKGCWVVEIATGLCELLEPRSYLYVLIILEENIDEIRSKLAEFFYRLNISANIDTIFPFAEIIKFGFQQQDEYWVKLAFDWYNHLSLIKKKSLKSTLEKLSMSKRTTQKLRNMARKEVKNLNNI